MLTKRYFWVVFYFYASPSPIEQNKRHIQVLKSLLYGEDILPTKLGFSLSPNFFSYVLVSPKSRVIRPRKSIFNTDMIIKADEIHKQITNNINNESTLSSMVSIAKIISLETLQKVGKRLISYHKPIKINYYNKFGITKKQNMKLSETINHQEKQEYYCYSCKKPISQKVALFCFNNKNRFQGKAYCYNCQKQF